MTSTFYNIRQKCYLQPWSDTNGNWGEYKVYANPKHLLCRPNPSNSPVALRELVSNPSKSWDGYIAKVLPSQTEWCVLNTCNRFKIYVAFPEIDSPSASHQQPAPLADTCLPQTRLQIPKEPQISCIIDCLYKCNWCCSQWTVDAPVFCAQWGSSRTSS